MVMFKDMSFVRRVSGCIFEFRIMMESDYLGFLSDRGEILFVLVVKWGRILLLFYYNRILCFES